MVISSQPVGGHGESSGARHAIDIQPPPNTPRTKPFRSLFLSDLHLGKRHCQAGPLLEFIQRHEADTVYLIGDIVDIWQLRKKMHWPASHDRVLQHFLALAQAGTRVIYLPGNHDDILRRSRNLRFGPVEFADRVEHHGADGLRYLVVHGDQYDVVLNNAVWLGPVGDWFYDLLLSMTAGLNAVQRRVGLRPRSLSAFVKHVVKTVVNHASHFEDVVVAELRDRRLDGVICGHLHHAAMRDMQGFRYINAGDWVESCTAVIEHHDGRMETIFWSEGNAR